MAMQRNCHKSNFDAIVRDSDVQTSLYFMNKCKFSLPHLRTVTQSVWQVSVAMCGEYINHLLTSLSAIHCSQPARISIINRLKEALYAQTAW